MGTRHLICVVVNKDYKVAQYGQWDGYPSGQGSGILDFLKSDFDKELFLSKLSQTFEATNDQITQWYKDAGNTRTDGMVDYDISKKFSSMFPSLSRDTGSDILKIIQDSEQPVPLRFDKGFAADSLFCEWAYVIDLDKNTFEVFEGFNKEPLDESERFYSLPVEEGSKYQPVKHLHTFHLDALPSNDDFVLILEPEESE
ncbi:hypothetical protein BJD20_13300 [Acinetobacter proteolyticus]|uniref:hypothetical protein n=1 Tax=Acinetobacter proteolyticus TaxID=1776741 RepID=UPI0008633236|nr:hypothetical protein [Acinetobacter proteolyticus]OEY96073.1 hypothetical protein BJD20_13300 [Acinetobacter proteolyticus]